MTKTCLKSLHTQMLNVTMFHHLNTNRWDLHINQPRAESCIKHVCCISRMNFYMSDFKHKIYGLYTRKYGMIKASTETMLWAPQNQLLTPQMPCRSLWFRDKTV